MYETNYQQLEEIHAVLLDAAEKTMDNSYAPSSYLNIGAAVRGASGKIYTGANIENASYGLTMCAERVAIFKGISEGERRFNSLALIARGISREKPRINPINDLITPCGACRQIMEEYLEPNSELIFSTTSKGKILITKPNKLLSLPFGPTTMGYDRDQYWKTMEEIIASHNPK